MLYWKVGKPQYLSLLTKVCKIQHLVPCRSGERGGSVVECRTPEREVRGSRPTAAVLCPWARHFTPRKYWLITQEAMAPSRHDWKIVDWDVKPQLNQPTNRAGHCASIASIREHNYNKYIRSPEYSHPNNIESHIIRWTTLYVRSCSTTATAFSGRSFQPWVISALSRFGLGRFGLSRFGAWSFRPNLVGRFGLIFN